MPVGKPGSGGRLGWRPLSFILACFAFYWNFGNRRACLNMRHFGSAVIALIVLWLVDLELNHGRYTEVVLTAARGLARSIGIR
jgi:hypothetical protein